MGFSTFHFLLEDAFQRKIFDLGFTLWGLRILKFSKFVCSHRFVFVTPHILYYAVHSRGHSLC